MYSTMKSTSNIRDFKYFQNSLGFKINKLSKELKRYSSKIIKAYPSLGIPELFTLNVIGENKKEVTIKYIASVHWADQAEISRGVQKLIKLSLINKAKNHDDLRYTLLKVTSDGDRNKKLLKDFSNEEIVHMQKLLDKLLISSQKYLILN